MKTIFIDRHSEINTIKELLTSTKKRAAILLGDGGIGKTRFLQRINEIAEDEYKRQGISVLMWLDFDEYTQKDRPEIYVKNKFLDAANLTKEISEEISDPHSISFMEISQRINKKYPKRKLFLFDTLEKLSDPRIKSALFEIFENIDNSVFIFAGRPAIDKQSKNEFDDFTKQAKEIDPSLKLLVLKEFNPENAIKYITHKARLRRVFLSNRDKKNLAELSHGVPILLDLATDYLASNIRIRNLVENVSDFEMHLVEQIKRLKSPLDLAVLVLSVVYPLDGYSLARMLDIKNEKIVDQIFKKLKSLSFVKVLPDGQILLHDKMEDLIKEYIWNRVDSRPSTEFQSQLFTKAFEFYKKRDQDLAVERRKIKNKLKNAKKLSAIELFDLNRKLDIVTSKREVATQKWVRYGLAVNVQSVWPDYTKLIADVRTGRKYEFIQKLVDEMGKTFYSDQELYLTVLNSEQRYQLEFISARSKKDTGKLEAAIKDLETMLAKYGENTEKRYRILNLLASTQTQSGRLKYLYAALKNHEECLQFYELRLAKSRDPKNLLEIARIENQIGVTYRLLEDDEVNAYDYATEHYLKGREAILEYKEQLDKRLRVEVDGRQKLLVKEGIKSAKKTLAAINTGLGYLQGLQGSYENAYDLIENAISIWEQTEDKREIARAKNAKAILKRDQARFDEAAVLFEEALQLPHAEDDHLSLCRIYHHKGWNEWELAAKAGFETEQGIKLLEEAHKSLTLGIKSIGADTDYVREISGIYHNISEMQWKLGQVYKKKGLRKIGKEMLDTARKNNTKAIELSKKSENIHYLIDALVGEIQYDLELGDFSKIDRYINQVEKYKEKYPQFGLYYGRMYMRKGDSKFLLKKYDSAYEMYSKGLPMIYQKKPGEGSYGFVEEKKIIKEKTNKLSSKLARRYFEYLRSIWSKDGQYKDLVNWCDSEIYRLRIAE